MLTAIFWSGLLLIALGTLSVILGASGNAPQHLLTLGTTLVVGRTVYAMIRGS